jgi:hypothetical protein
MSVTHTSFGILTPEHDFPVFNERGVRAGAGLLFVFGFSGWLIALTQGDFSLLRAFGAFFMFDMFMRLFLGQRYAPSLVVGGFFVRNQRPEWVEAKPKQTAWAIGFAMVLIACFMMGWLGLQGEIILALCGFCMVFLFAEAAFGFCAGCWLHQKFSKEKPKLCSGDVCNYHPEGTHK